MTDPHTNQKKRKKDDFLMQGMILALAMVMTKVIGALYRIPLTNILGDEGNGFYGYAFEVYAFALMLSSLSLPTASFQTCFRADGDAPAEKCVSGFLRITGFFRDRRRAGISDRIFRSGYDRGKPDEITAERLCAACARCRTVCCCAAWRAARVFSGIGNDDADRSFPDHRAGRQRGRKYRGSKRFI